MLHFANIRSFPQGEGGRWASLGGKEKGTMSEEETEDGRLLDKPRTLPGQTLVLSEC